MRQNDPTQPYTIDIFHVLRKTVYRDSTTESTWYKAGSQYSSLEAARGFIKMDRDDMRRMQPFIDQGKSEYIIQRRTHIVHEVFRGE